MSEDGRRVGEKRIPDTLASQVGSGESERQLRVLSPEASESRRIRCGKRVVECNVFRPVGVSFERNREQRYSPAFGNTHRQPYFVSSSSYGRDDAPLLAKS